MSNNSNLLKANKAKQDEFYTQLVDIEKELRHYKEHFRGKVVFCNCDDPFESNFFKYFAMNFNHLGLKKLIATCYESSPIIYTQLNIFGEHIDFTDKKRRPYKIEINEVKDFNNDGATDLSDVEYLLRNDKNSLTLLKGDKIYSAGDFRSKECVNMLEQADIVVTNPPFSLFREYIAQLMAYEKSFLVIGNQNAITYKEIFPLLAKNLIWLGVNSGAQTFQVPDKYARDNVIVKDGKRYAKFGNICWFTNLDIVKRHENLILYKNYNELEYPRYDNYDAINVDKVSDIPCDYYGVMGVPITFLDKYNPEQFEIVAFRKGDDGKDLIYSYRTSEMSEHIGGGTRKLRTSEYSSDDVDRGNDKECRRKNQREDNLCSHNDTESTLNAYDDVIRPILDGKKLYRRITIRKI